MPVLLRKHTDVDYEERKYMNDQDNQTKSRYNTGAGTSDENDDLILARTLRVLNSLEERGVIERYAIGGAVGIIFYSEAFSTYNLDIFCRLPEAASPCDTKQLLEYLALQGYNVKWDHVDIEGVPVRFLEPNTDLEKEAFGNVIETTCEGVPMRVFKYEYLVAICAQNGSLRDRCKIQVALNSAHPDLSELEKIVQPHNAAWEYAAEPPGIPSPNEKFWMDVDGEIVSREEFFRRKAAGRYETAKEPIEKKLKSLFRIQWRGYQAGTAGGRYKPRMPWGKERPLELKIHEIWPAPTKRK